MALKTKKKSETQVKFLLFQKMQNPQNCKIQSIQKIFH